MTLAHEHPHPHSHSHSHHPAGERPPDGGPVVLDIGGGFGALIVRLPDAMFGQELHVRSTSGPEAASLHTGIWRRRLGAEDVVVAVFPELAAGEWAILDEHGADRHLVTIADGSVSELDLTDT